MNNKVVYFLLLHLEVGGVEIISINLANAFVEYGFDVKIICLLHDGELKNKLNPKIQVEYISQKGISNNIYFKIYWRLQKLKLAYRIKKIKNSIIISTRDEYNVLLSKYATSDNLRIAQLHHDYYYSKILKSHFKYNYTNVDYFVLLTPDVCDEITNIMRLYNSHTRCVTIPNFSPNGHFDSMLSKREKEILDFYKNQPYCIAVGRLAPEKGFDRLIKIWEIIQQKTNKNLKLLLVGDGKDRDSLATMVNMYSLNESVILLGNQSNALCQALIGHAVCYCMTSYTEGFSLVLLDALKQGTPQVAFDVRVGPRNLIVDQKTGFLIKNNNVDLYADAILKIYKSSQLRADFKVNSIIRAKDFDEKGVIQSWLKLFNTKFNEEL